jgi:hypothetical protein
MVEWEAEPPFPASSLLPNGQAGSEDSAATRGKADEPEGMQAISIELVHLIALDPCLQIF